MIYELDDFELKISKNLKIFARPWSSLDERKFLSQHLENSTKMDGIFRILMLPNLEFKPMTIPEFQVLFLEMRKLSVGADISLNVTCECGQFLEFDKNLDELIHFIEPDFSTPTIDSNGVIVKLRRIPTAELFKKILAQDNEEDKIYYEFLASIESVTYKNKETRHFTFDELLEFFNTAPSKVTNELLKKFFKIRGYLSLWCETTCPVCQRQFNTTFKDIVDFL